MENTHAQIEGYANCLQELIKELEERIEKIKKNKLIAKDIPILKTAFDGEKNSLLEFKKHLKAKLSKLQITEKK